MKKIIFVLITGLALFSGGLVLAQADDHTAREEAEGKIIWEKMQVKQASCDDLSEEDFGALGEYFMGQMLGQSHEAMNNMMIQMMGENGEEQMHVVMGKRLSGCDTSAAYPSQGLGFMPMMQMMGGGGGMMGGGMNFGGSPMGWSGFNSWFVNLTWIVWLVVGILAAIWLLKKIK